MRHSMLLVLTLAAAGCAPGDPGPAPDSHTASVPSAATAADDAAVAQDGGANELPVPGEPAPEVPAPAGDPSGSPEATGRAADTGATLALEGEGLRVFSVPSGAARAIGFGTDKADTVEMLTRVQGSPPSAQGENLECRLTTATWPDGLTVMFSDGRFVGWSVGKADSPLSTAGGLKIGSTRSEVENGASVATIAPSSIGEEFTAGDVAGLLASAAPDARVTDLWAGQVCIAR